MLDLQDWVIIPRSVEQANGLENNIEYGCSQQFSIIALTDGSGAITEWYAYSAYGMPLVLVTSELLPLESQDFTNRFMYTGRECDGLLELYHFRTRMYDAVAGRFLGRDSIGYESGFSLYD